MIETILQEFLHFLFLKNSSEHTIRNYSVDLHFFLAFLKENYPQNNTLLNINLIDKKIIREFLAYLSSLNLNKKTMSRRLSALKSFFRFAFHQKIIEKNPLENFQAPKIAKKIPTFLTYDQVKNLLELPDTTSLLGLRDRVIMEVFYSSGLRVSELVALNQSDFDSAALLIKIKGKGKKERIIPITKNAARWILIYLEHPKRQYSIEPCIDKNGSFPLFLNKHGKRLSSRSVDRNFEVYLKKSGLAAKITPHTIRHTIATHWLENGMNLKTIQTLLGHSALSTTTIYTQVSTKLKQKTYHRCHPRAKLSNNGKP